MIQLSPRSEPEIYASTRRFGTILENVVFDQVTRHVDLDDDRFTENTRASYPLDFIANAVPSRTRRPSQEHHPPHVRRVGRDAADRAAHADQALYHFISGYTSKIAGTEVGLGLEPEITFSTCFGAPFMVHHPVVYADLLKRKIERHGARCWLVNTGWIGGPYGVGKRISIGTRAPCSTPPSRARSTRSSTAVDPIFGFEVPEHCPGLPDDVLRPETTWPSEEEYWARYRELAARYVGNFRKFAPECPQGLVGAGPRLERVSAA